MPRFAAIDLGTHNCRLLIAEKKESRFHVLHGSSNIVRLGEGAAKTGQLQPAARARTLQALKEFSTIIQGYAVDKTRAVVTEAGRMAENAKEFFVTVKRETGLDFKIFSAKDEVWTSVVASADLIQPSIKNIVMFDIGGGSTEIVLIHRQGKKHIITDWVSKPVGVVRGRDAMKKSSIREIEFQKQVASYQKIFESFFKRNNSFFTKPYQVIGTSGTMTSLAGLTLNLSRYQREKVDGARLGTKHLKEWAKDASLRPSAWREKSSVIGEARAEYLVPGCAIFLGLGSFLHSETITVGDRGLREGLMREMAGPQLSVEFRAKNC